MTVSGRRVEVLGVNTEWKYTLNNEAFSKSDVAEVEL